MKDELREAVESHTFKFDVSSGTFEEKGVSVTDEDLVKLALEPFLRKIMKR